MPLKRSYANPLDLILMGLPHIDQLTQHWANSQCACTHGQSNTRCPLYKIIRHVRRQRSFATFLQFTHLCSDIKRVVASKQLRPKYLKYTSKCKSGRFYRRMPHATPRAIRTNPQLYAEIDSLDLHDYKDDDGDGSATEEMDTHDTNRSQVSLSPI